MKLPHTWRFALGTCWCVTALWGCAEGTLHREDDVQPRDNPFPGQLTLTRGAIPGQGELPLPSHTIRPREPSVAVDAGSSDEADAATLADAAPADATASGDAGDAGDAGN